MAVDGCIDVALVGEQVTLAYFLVGFVILEKKLIDVLIVFKGLFVLRNLRGVLILSNFFVDVAEFDVFIVKGLNSKIFKFLARLFDRLPVAS